MTADPLSVAMVSEHASPLACVGGTDAGGQNVHVAALASALTELGIEVDVYTRRDSPDLSECVELAPGVTVCHVDAGPPEPLPKDTLLPHMARFATQLQEAWRQRRPQVVHSHFWMSGWASLAAAAPLNLPVVHTFHALGSVKRREQGSEDTSPPERLPIERSILNRVDRILATCSDEVHELAALGAQPSRVTVVPCGVDLSLFWPDGPVEPRRADPRQPWRLLVVGRLVRRKGVDDVISALPQIPGAELVVAGGPDTSALDHEPEVARLRDLAHRLGVAERVDLRGRVGRKDLPAIYRSADLVVCAPWYEPFGIVPLEAMGCGVPVVATAVGGMLDTVVNGTTGVHVPPRRPDLLAGAMNKLLSNQQQRAAMGRAATKRARLYSWRRVAAATLRSYEDLTVHAGFGASDLLEQVSGQ